MGYIEYIYVVLKYSGKGDQEVNRHCLGGMEKVYGLYKRFLGVV